MNSNDRENITLDGLAALLKAGKQTVYRFAQNGELPAFKLGSTWCLHRAELGHWINANCNQHQSMGKGCR